MLTYLHSKLKIKVGLQGPEGSRQATVSCCGETDLIENTSLTARDP